MLLLLGTLVLMWFMYFLGIEWERGNRTAKWTFILVFVLTLAWACLVMPD